MTWKLHIRKDGKAVGHTESSLNLKAQFTVLHKSHRETSWKDVMLQGQGERVGAALTGDYQALASLQSCSVRRGPQNRMLPLTLSDKFSRTAHAEVIFLVLFCLVGSEISYMKNNLKTFFHQTSHSLVLLSGLLTSGCRMYSNCQHTSSWAQNGAVRLLH